MPSTLRNILLTAAVILPIGAHAVTPTLTVTVAGVRSGQPIPASQALCVPTADGKSDKVKAATRPTIRWSGAPEGTASFAVFMMDPDVPADFSDAGKVGKVIAADAKRQDFFHYGVINIPAGEAMLAGGPAAQAPAIGAELANDLGANGYVSPPSAFGGPCPPWNDARVHHYHFVVLALDKDAPVSVDAKPDDARRVNETDSAKNTYNRLIASSHVLAKGAVVGSYTLNPALRK